MSQFPYLILQDYTEVTHSEILKEDGTEKVRVYFSRMRDEALYDTAVCELPSYTWLQNEGFSPDDIRSFAMLLHKNQADIFDCARKGKEDFFSLVKE